tara:strand:+ start:3831 stop:4259 length:429 start_codon:yes stop_codon:yes gene_type:complete
MDVMNIGYSIILINNNNNNNYFYDIKNNLSLKEKYINLYNLEKKGLYKSFYKNNILIISNEITTNFYKITEKEIINKDNYLIIRREKKLISSFQINFPDYEEDYILYEKSVNDIIINLRIYKTYFELEYITDDLNKFNNLEK